MKVRLVKEIADANRRSSIYKLGSSIEFKEPLVIFITPTKSTLSIHDNVSGRMNLFLNSDNITNDFDVIHIRSNVHTGVIYSDQFTLVGRAYMDNNILPAFRNAFFQSTVEVLTSKGVDSKQSTHSVNSNDIVFVKDDKDKKFCGSLINIKESYFSFIITIKFDAQKLDGIFKLDTDKFKARGVVNSISDVVGGLDEVLPGVDKSIVDEIFNSIATKLDWQIEETSFTIEEEAVIKNPSI
jgi:hypothetical protein